MLALGAALLLGVAGSTAAALVGPIHFVSRLLGADAAVRLRVLVAFNVGRLSGGRLILMAGDSRMEALRRRIGGTGNDFVVNTAVSGTTARFWRSALEDLEPAGGSTVFVLWVGVNDLLHLRARPEAALANLEAVVRSLCRAPHARVVVLEQVPIRTGGPRDASLNDEIVAFNRGLASLARAVPQLSVIPLHARLAAGAGLTPRDEYYSDGLHLSERGEALVRRLLDEALR